MPNPDSSRLLSRPNLPYLQTALIASLAALIVVSTALIYAWQAFDDATIRNDGANRTLQNARQAERDAMADHATWQRYHPLYLRLKKAGVVAGEDRLRLVEALEQLKRDGDIRQLSYTVAPQDKVDWPTREPLDKLNLMRSHVQLTFQAPDSAAVLAAVAAAQKLPGLAQPLGCSWQNDPAGRGNTVPTTPGQPLLLSVRCDLAWLSLAPKAPPP